MSRWQSFGGRNTVELGEQQREGQQEHQKPPHHRAQRHHRRHRHGLRRFQLVAGDERGRRGQRRQRHAHVALRAAEHDALVRRHGRCRLGGGDARQHVVVGGGGVGERGGGLGGSDGGVGGRVGGLGGGGRGGRGRCGRCGRCGLFSL